ncbi:MAG TPA: HAMP domain-containing protein, partial [Thermomicrobiales bacterium]|nr:HAMP domain-containing protein [Thermomicrobiales bacterium]
MSAPPSPIITPPAASDSGTSAAPSQPPVTPQPPQTPPNWSDGPPPWWPDDEPFPPMWWPEGGARPPKRRGPRGGFLRRVGCFFGAVVGLMVVTGLLGALFSPGRHGGPPFGFLGFVVLVLIVIWAGRALRGTAAPIGDVMEAADRVAAGDYGVRVDTRAKGEVGRLVHSFNAMTSRLQANEVQRRNLLADIAHELRTPLTVVRGTVEGMLDGVYPRDDE